MISLLHRNDNFVTVHNKCSKIPPWTSVHFATSVPRSRVVRLSWSSRLFMRAAAFKLRAIRLVYPLFFCKVRSSSSPTNSQIKTVLSRQPFRIRHMFIWPFFITMTDTIPSQNMNVSSWITLYKQLLLHDLSVFQAEMATENLKSYKSKGILHSQQNLLNQVNKTVRYMTQIKLILFEISEKSLYYGRNQTL